MHDTTPESRIACGPTGNPVLRWGLKLLPVLFWLGVGVLILAPVIPNNIVLPSPDTPPFYNDHEGLRRFDQALSSGNCLTPHALLWMILPPLFLHDFSYLLDALLIAAGAAYYLRGRSLPNSLAWLGGGMLAFVGYSFTLIAAGHRGYFQMGVYCVFLLGLLLRAVRTEKWTYFALAGACAGWAIDSAPDFSFLYLGVAASYAVWLVFSGTGPVNKSLFRRIRTVLFLLPIFLLFMALTSWTGVRDVFTVFRPQRESLLSATAGQPTGTTEPSRPDPAAKHSKWIFATNWSLPPEETLEFVAPCVMGTQTCDPAAPYWGSLGRTDGWEHHKQGFPNFRQHTIYLGALQLVLAAFAVCYAWRNRRKKYGICGVQASETNNPLLADVPFWTILAVVGLLLAMGRFTPFYRLFYELPYMSLLRAPVKFIRFVELSVCLLAALGLGCLLENRNSKRPMRLRGWVIPTTLLAIAFLIAAFVVSMSLPIVGNPVGQLGMGVIADRLRSNASSALLHAVTAFGVASILFWGVAKQWLNPKRAILLVFVWVSIDVILVDRRFIQTQDVSPWYDRNEVVQRVASGMPMAPMIANHTPARQQDWFRHSLQVNGIAHCEPPAGAAASDPQMQFLRAFEKDPIRFWELSGAGFALVPGQAARSLVGDRVDFAEWIAFANGRVVTPKSQEDAYALLRVKNPVPYAWLSPNWICVSNEIHLAAVVSRTGDPLNQAIVSSRNPLTETVSSSHRQGNLKVLSIRFEHGARTTSVQVETSVPQILTIRIPFAETGNMIARMDQGSVSLLQSGFLWSGVLIPPGSHRLEIGTTPRCGWPLASTLPLLIVGLLFFPGKVRTGPR